MRKYSKATWLLSALVSVSTLVSTARIGGAQIQAPENIPMAPWDCPPGQFCHVLDQNQTPNTDAGGSSSGSDSTWFGSGDSAEPVPTWLAIQMVSQGYNWDGTALSITINGTKLSNGSSIDSTSSARLNMSGVLTMGNSRFQLVDASTYPRPSEVAIVRSTNASGASPMMMAVAPIPIIAYGYSTAINNLLTQQRLAQIASLPNAALRLAAINQLINIMEAARQVGAAISIAELESMARIERAYRELVALSKLAPAASANSTGAIALRIFAQVSGGAAAFGVGYLFGSYIYNNNNWLNQGGLDPVFQALENQVNIGGQGEIPGGSPDCIGCPQGGF